MDGASRLRLAGRPITLRNSIALASARAPRLRARPGRGAWTRWGRHSRQTAAPWPTSGGMGTVSGRRRALAPGRGGSSRRGRASRGVAPRCRRPAARAGGSARRPERAEVGKGIGPEATVNEAPASLRPEDCSPAMRRGAERRRRGRRRRLQQRDRVARLPSGPRRATDAAAADGHARPAACAAIGRAPSQSPDRVVVQAPAARRAEPLADA
jgi:hypothetical protein